MTHFPIAATAQRGLYFFARQVLGLWLEFGVGTARCMRRVESLLVPTLAGHRAHGTLNHSHGGVLHIC